MWEQTTMLDRQRTSFPRRLQRSLWPWYQPQRSLLSGLVGILIGLSYLIHHNSNSSLSDRTICGSNCDAIQSRTHTHFAPDWSELTKP